MHVRGIRGATTVAANTEGEILAATRELLQRMVAENDAEPDEISAILFTCTPDLNAAFPAEAARHLEWTAVPLLSATEVAVPGALPRCIRVLMLWNCARSQEQVQHVYLRDAAGLRPDLKPQK